MINQYLRILVKNIKKDCLNSSFAIISFSIGLIVFALISSYVLFHLEYDSSMNDAEHWYRLRVSETKKNAQTVDYAGFYGSVMSQLINEVPEIKEYTLRSDYHFQLKFTDKNNNIIPLAMNSCFATPNYLKLLNLKYLYGDADSSFSKLNDLVISKSYALKYFGKVNAIGEKVFLRSNELLKVSGVFEDMPDNSHYKIDAFRVNIKSLHEDKELNLSKENIFIRITDKNKVPNVEKKINQFLKEYDTSSQVKRVSHIDPIRKVHFIQNLIGDFKTKNLSFIYALGLLAFFLLISAYLNFYNLLNLSWKKRISEFVNRKILGASKKDIIQQIMTEYSVSYIITIMLSVILYFSIKAFFYQYSEVNCFAYELFTNVKISLLMMMIVIILWFFGFIPASQMANIEVNNEIEKVKKKNSYFKYILFSQIFISAFFIFIALLTYAQINFIRHYDLKYDYKNLLQYSQKCAEISDYVSPKVLRQELEKIPEINSVTMTVIDLVDILPLEAYLYTIASSEVNGKEINGNVLICPVSKDFFINMKIKVLKGDANEVMPVSRDGKSDYAMLSQSAARLFFPNIEALNKKMKMPNATVKVIIDDVHFEPLYQQMIPKVYVYTDFMFNYIQLRYKEGTKDIVIKKANKVFDRLTHNNVFYYDYVDVEEKINEYYKDDILLFNLIVFFALICSVIAIMGIYSISSLHIFSQMKDIAIHKVNGAEMLDIFKRYFKFYAILGGSAWLSASAFSLYLLDIYMHKFKVQMKYTYLLLILSFAICFLMILIPLYLNVKKAYKSDASIYLNND